MYVFWKISLMQISLLSFYKTSFDITCMIKHMISDSLNHKMRYLSLAKKMFFAF